MQVRDADDAHARPDADRRRALLHAAVPHRDQPQESGEDAGEKQEGDM